MCCGKCKEAGEMDKVTKAIVLIKEAQEIYNSMTEEEKLAFNTELDKIPEVRKE
jgi:hypothetical protein